MKVVYVAGPFTAPNAWERELNVRAAENYAMEVAKMGAMPLCPHTNTRFFEGTCTPEFWYEGTLELLRRCDTMIVLPTWLKSVGTRREFDEAGKLALPVHHNLQSLSEWLEKWKGRDFRSAPFSSDVGR